MSFFFIVFTYVRRVVFALFNKAKLYNVFHALLCLFAEKNQISNLLIENRLKCALLSRIGNNTLEIIRNSSKRKMGYWRLGCNLELFFYFLCDTAFNLVDRAHKWWQLWSCGVEVLKKKNFKKLITFHLKYFLNDANNFLDVISIHECLEL